jgi:hypothetical protein
MKTCFKCGLEKPLTEFYKHKQMADGYLNKCKVCTQSDVRSRYNHLKEDEHFLNAERKRGRKKYHRLYAGDSTTTSEARKKWEHKFPEKKEASSSAQNLEPLFENAQRHHWSYNEVHYKDVIWLTSREHGKAHRFLEYDQTYKMYRRKDNKELLNTKEMHEQYIRKCINDEDD